MRRLLDRIYFLCGALAAVFLAAIAALILSQIIARALGLFIPAANDFAGFCLAASSFLALAYSCRAGSHAEPQRLSSVRVRQPSSLAARRAPEAGRPRHRGRASAREIAARSRG